MLNCLRLLMDGPCPSLLSLTRLLSDSTYRTSLQGHCTDPIVRKFWEGEFELWDDDDVLPLRRTIGDLLSSPVVRNILGQQRSTFAFDHGHIIIANLDRRKLGDATAFLLGALLLSKSQGQTYVENLGFFGDCKTLVDLIQQDRLTGACSFLHQCPMKLQQALLGIDEKIVFQTTREDAERLAFYVGVSNPSVLTDLMPAEARTKAGVIEPTAPPSLARFRAIQRRSRARHTRSRGAVERRINRYFAA